MSNKSILYRYENWLKFIYLNSLKNFRDFFISLNKNHTYQKIINASNMKKNLYNFDSERTKNWKNA